jgi:hypothetical protein
VLSAVAVRRAARAALGSRALDQVLLAAALRNAGAVPDMVQVGNEITPGMLHPDGHTYDPDEDTEIRPLSATLAVSGGWVRCFRL